MHCYFHNDQDGIASGYLVKKICNMYGIGYNIMDFTMASYDNPFADHDENEDVIFLVDLSFTMKTLERLERICKAAKKVIWVDHHRSSFELIANENFHTPSNLFGFLSETGCGALNTYRLFRSLSNDLDVNTPNRLFGEVIKGKRTDPFIMIMPDLELKERFRIPSWLSFIDDYDRWIKKLPNTDAFHYGMEAAGINMILPNKDGYNEFNPIWEELFRKDDCLKYIDAGKAIIKYTEEQYKRELSSCFEVAYMDTIILCKNGRIGSANFGERYYNYDACSVFYYDGNVNLWKHSIYSHDKSNFDCSKFAETYGGGGHFHAAGFSMRTPLWLNV